MERFELQGRLNLLMRGCIHYPSKAVSQHNSPFLFVIIVLIHLLLIAIALNSKFKPRERSSFESIIQLVQLQPEKAIAVVELEQPNINFKTNSIYLGAPELSFKESYRSELDLSLPKSNQIYEFPDGTVEQYKDVFDPKLRKKLIEAKSLNIVRAAEKQKRWTAPDGALYMDDGEGHCRHSMLNVDTHSTATNWSTLTLNGSCSKDEGGRMMDNINADLEARKHPLKTQ